MIDFSYRDLIAIENIFQAWKEFRKEKGNKSDVQIFERNLEDNIFNLYDKLKNKRYQHGPYEDFYVNDPKRRHIHKANVVDRVLHHLLYKYLYNTFDKTFIYDSYSCRIDKGTHRAVLRLEKFTRKVSRNYTGDCWALKLDIKKFFASVDHNILLGLLEKRIQDKDILELLKEVILSFNSDVLGGKGIPLGNLTSQVFANIYLNELDQYIKQNLKAKYYIRYADDFVIVSADNEYLKELIPKIESFLIYNLKMKLHPKKIILRKLSWGIDFLGYIVLPHIILPRTKTKRRVFKKIERKIKEYGDKKISYFSLNQTAQSYLGYFKHSSSYVLTQKLKDYLWFRVNP